MKYSLGIDIGGTKCAVVLGRDSFSQGPESAVIDSRRFPTDAAAPPEAVIGDICASMDSLMSDHGVSAEELIGIGISCGGPLDSGRGVVLGPPNLPGWGNIPICQLLESRYRVGARLENDANACALAEWTLGAARGCDNAVFLTFGTGMGAGVIANGRLYSGASGMAGEIGHIRLESFGPVGYGKAGSFEGFCSGGGIAQLAALKARERLQSGGTCGFCRDLSSLDKLTAKKVAEAAAGGDELAAEVFAICGCQLGRGLAVLVDILNPEIIVIGSIFARAQRLLRPSMEEALNRESLARSREACRIVPSALGDDIGSFGALSVAVYHFGHRSRGGPAVPENV